MKRIKIDFSDFWHAHTREAKVNNHLYRLLAKRFDLELTDDPDFLVYSCIGKRFLQHRCVRIFYTGENLRPNYNECDYAFSFDYPVDERNYRLPIYRLDDAFDELARETDVDRIFEQKTRFCNFVYANPYPKERNEFFRKLSTYKKVDAPGPVFHNIDGPIEPDYANKMSFIRRYKFTIAFENSSHPGYTTEKLVHAMAANTVPIYWGNPLVHQDFNPAAFINCHEYGSLDEVIERVIEVDNDDTLYKQYLAEPCHRDGVVNEYSDENNILDRFESIFRETDIRPVASTWKNHLARLNHSVVVWAPRKAFRLARQWLSLRMQSFGSEVPHGKP